MIKRALVLLLAGGVAIAHAQTVLVDFRADDIGNPPKGFSAALTGKGEPGKWLVAYDGKDSSRVTCLAQTSMDRTGYRFPVCVYDGVTAADVDVSVHFKPLKGKEDRAAGIVWRYVDRDNYYVVRANALEGNVVLYKVEKGKRTDLPLQGKGRTYGVKRNVPTGVWGILRVVARGDLFEVYQNGEKIFGVRDGTFKDPGRVGLWTKADSYTLFTDLSITPLK